MSEGTATTLWYVRVDDKTRAPGPREVTREEWERIRRATASIFQTLPNGSFLYPCEKSGTVGVTIPSGQIEHVDQVDAAFLNAGYKRDPHAPQPNTISLR